MPAPYSDDLRQKAMKALKTKRVSEVSAMFDIHRTTLGRWKRRLEADGHYSAVTNYQEGHSHKITNWSAFEQFVDKYGDKTQAEMAQLWPDEISEATIGRALKALNQTRKKRRTPTPNETKQGEPPFSQC